MIRPPPRSIIPSSAARVTVMVPRRLTAMILSQVSSAESTNSSITSMPALLTRMSGGPSSAATRLTAARTAVLSAMSTSAPTVRAP